uniref:Uncharacterized protein n=1 Tax=Physcomitrium patens TaxID=3218 RepID=A0A7I4DRB1_PHYPA
MKKIEYIKTYRHDKEEGKDEKHDFAETGAVNAVPPRVFKIRGTTTRSIRGDGGGGGNGPIRSRPISSRCQRGKCRRQGEEEEWMLAETEQQFGTTLAPSDFGCSSHPVASQFLVPCAEHRRIRVLTLPHSSPRGCSCPSTPAE